MDRRDPRLGLFLFAVLTLGALAVVMLAVLTLVFGAEEKRIYHPVDIAALAADDPHDWKAAHTHVEIVGIVTYAIKEADGDLHIRVCDQRGLTTMDRAHCVVCECIPELPCAKPKVGSRVKVQGIYRFDAEKPNHMWAELHPVEHLSAP